MWTATVREVSEILIWIKGREHSRGDQQTAWFIFFYATVWKICLLAYPFSPSLETGGSLPGRNLVTKGSPGREIAC